MQSVIKSKRKIDSVISIVQDTSEKTIVIESINPAAEKLLGYPESELVGTNLQGILPENACEFIDDYVDEWQEGDEDISYILRKIPNFHIKNKRGKLLPTSLKVFYTLSPSKNKHDFELLMRDLTMINRIKEIKEKLAINKGNEIDVDTGMQNSEKIIQSLEITHSFVQNSPVEISFAAISIDGINDYAEAHGEKAAFVLVKAIGDIVEGICREDDVVGHLGEGYIGVVLLDCNTENAAAVTKRILSKVANNPVSLPNGDQTSITITIIYRQLTSDLSAEDTYHLCVENIQVAQNQSGNKSVSI